VREAAANLQNWFKVRDSAISGNEVQAVRLITMGQIEPLRQLSAELDSHASRIAHQAFLVEVKITAAKEIMAGLECDVESIKCNYEERRLDELAASSLFSFLAFIRLRTR